MKIAKRKLQLVLVLVLFSVFLSLSVGATPVSQSIFSEDVPIVGPVTNGDILYAYSLLGTSVSIVLFMMQYKRR